MCHLNILTDEQKVRLDQMPDAYQCRLIDYVEGEEFRTKMRDRNRTLTSREMIREAFEDHYERWLKIEESRVVAAATAKSIVGGKRMPLPRSVAIA